MRKTAPHITNSENTISVSELSLCARDWINDSRVRQLSPRTIGERQGFADKLIWFLQHKKFETCGPSQLREFLVYLGTAHESAEGRWGNPNPRMRQPLRPITIRHYHTQCRVLFNWLVEEAIINESPMAKIRPPRALPDQVRPFSPEQVQALLHAARRSKHPRRDEALLLIMLDTRMRASEICGLRMRDVDFKARCSTVIGKGNKRRTIVFGGTVSKALWNYVREERRKDDEPVFISDRGTRTGEAMTRSGLLQLVNRLGKKAGIEATRCSPHTFRHTFAVEFLRPGGNAFTLQQMLGHTSLNTTNRYVALAQADIENQHRQFSPADRLRSNRHAQGR